MLKPAEKLSLQTKACSYRISGCNTNEEAAIYGPRLRKYKEMSEEKLAKTMHIEEISERRLRARLLTRWEDKLIKF